MSLHEHTFIKHVQNTIKRLENFVQHIMSSYIPYFYIVKIFLHYSCNSLWIILTTSKYANSTSDIHVNYAS